MKVPTPQIKSVFADIPSRAHVRLAPAVYMAHIYARRRDGSSFIWQRSVSICKQGRAWYWYSKQGHIYIQLTRKRDKRFFLAGHSQKETGYWR